MYKKTKLLLVTLVLLIFPAASFAAFNDVTLTTDTVINVASTNLNISGSSAVVESIVVGADSFNVVLQSGSSLKITSSDRKTFTVSPSSGDYTSSGTCGSSSSSLTITSTGSITLTITPSVACASSSTPGSGRGGGVIQNALPNQLVPRKQIIYPDGRIVYLDEQAVEKTQTTEVKQSFSAPSFAPFKATLKRGMRNNDTKRLQELLASDPSIYPEGLITGYFGPLTEKAIQRFQSKNNIVSSGNPKSTGYGLVGPKTRAKLQEIFAQ